MKDKCLIIGGAGFLGQNLSRYMIDCGYHISIYDRKQNPFTDKYRDKINYVQGDIFKDKFDDSVLNGQDIVIFLACSVGPKTSMENPELCYKRDVIELISLLDRMKEKSINKMYFISSGGTVYGKNAEGLIDEEANNYPINHYGILKLTQEKILLMYNELFGMENVVFRLANPYGIGQSITSEIGAVTTFLDAVLTNKKICIYGDGRVVRDYIYVDDFSAMLCLFIENDDKKHHKPIYNIGTGKGNSLIHIIDVIEDMTKKKAEVEYFSGRKIDVLSNILDNAKIKEVIGDYSCKTLEEGIKAYGKRLGIYNG